MLRRHLTAFVVLGLTLPARPAGADGLLSPRHFRQRPAGELLLEQQRPGRGAQHAGREGRAPAGRFHQLPVTAQRTAPGLAVRPGGGWDAEIHLVNFPNRYPELSGKKRFISGYTPRRRSPPTICPSWCSPMPGMACRWRSSRAASPFRSRWQNTRGTFLRENGCNCGYRCPLSSRLPCMNFIPSGCKASSFTRAARWRRTYADGGPSARR